MDALEFIIKDVMGPILKDHKFKKSKHVWNKQIGDKIVGVIKVQKEYYTPDESSFTINFGIYFVGTNELMFDKTSKFYYEYDCLYKGRPRGLGMSLDWWPIKDVISVPELIKLEVQDFLEVTLLPFLAEKQSIDAVVPVLPIEKWMNNTNFNDSLIRLACAYSISNNVSAAKAILQKIYTNKEPWFEIAEVVINKMKHD